MCSGASPRRTPSRTSAATRCARSSSSSRKRPRRVGDAPERRGADMDNRAVVAVIAEDEAVLREELQTHLEALWPELEIRAAVADGHAALAALAEHRPQLLFLDIQMPGL